MGVIKGASESGLLKAGYNEVDQKAEDDARGEDHRLPPLE
jgi:hypothetical protein